MLLLEGQLLKWGSLPAGQGLVVQTALLLRSITTWISQFRINFKISAIALKFSQHLVLPTTAVGTGQELMTFSVQSSGSVVPANTHN